MSYSIVSDYKVGEEEETKPNTKTGKKKKATTF